MQPTRLANDVKSNLNTADLVSIKSNDFNILSGMLEISDVAATNKEQSLDPKTIKIQTISSMAVKAVKWIVDGDGDFTVTIKSVKGGTDSKKYSF